MYFNSVEFYTILLVIAFALLGVIFVPKNKQPVSTKIVPMRLTPESHSNGESSHITLTARPGGSALLAHPGLPLHMGETVNLVVHKSGDTLKIIERKGVSVPAASLDSQGEALLTMLQPRTYSLRFDSEVTGQWATTQFCNVEGNVKTIPLSY